jgi:hypothetical protein
VCRGEGRLASFRVAHRRPVQCKTVSGVHETVQDGVGDRGICDQVVPVLNGDLAGHDRRAATVAVVDDVEQVAALLRGERREPPILRYF